MGALVIVWSGPSRLDGKTPVVLVLTGVETESRNAKTGAMVQSWILVDGQRPAAAVASGADAAICGDCRHRGADGVRTCYVSLGQGLGAVGRRLDLGGYTHVSIRQAVKLLKGRHLRIGTYGDPAAVPVSVWRDLTTNVAGWTGYTHQWRRFPALRDLCMASVDSPLERAAARAAGWRTFRVRSVGVRGPEPLGEREIVCPAAAEAGHRAHCETCGLCAGAGPAKDIAIVDHSNTGRAALRRLATGQMALPVLA